MSASPDEPQFVSWTLPFWEAARNHKFVIQECVDCGTLQWYPKPACAKCLSRRLTWREVDGSGTVYSFTVIRQFVTSRSELELPYVVALLELDVGPRVLARVDRRDQDSIEIGRRGKIEFQDMTGMISVPIIKLI